MQPIVPEFVTFIAVNELEVCLSLLFVKIF